MIDQETLDAELTALAMTRAFGSPGEYARDIAAMKSGNPELYALVQASFAADRREKREQETRTAREMAEKEASGAAARAEAERIAAEIATRRAAAAANDPLVALLGQILNQMRSNTLSALRMSRPDLESHVSAQFDALDSLLDAVAAKARQ